MFKKASDWLAQTGQEVLAEDANITDAVRKLFFIIDPIMHNHGSSNLWGKHRAPSHNNNDYKKQH